MRNSEDWPIQKVIDINDEYKKKYYAECTTDLVEIIDSKNDSCFVENLLIGNFGSLKKLLQVTCYVLRFVKNWSAKLRSDKEKIINEVISFNKIQS